MEYEICQNLRENVKCDGQWHEIFFRKGEPAYFYHDSIREDVIAEADHSRFAPCPQRKRRQTLEFVQKIRGEYLTLDGHPMGWESFDPAAESPASTFMRTYDGAGKVILGGPTGRGKTHIARATYVALLSQFKESIWITAANLQKVFLSMQSWNHDETDRHAATDRYQQVSSADCLFIDDLGEERLTDSEMFQQEFKTLLETLRGGLVITTNVDSAEILKRYGEKIHSRLFANTQVFVLKGEDYRRRTFPKLKTNA